MIELTKINFFIVWVEEEGWVERGHREIFREG